MKTSIQAGIVVACLGLATVAHAGSTGKNLNGRALNGQLLNEGNPKAAEDQSLPKAAENQSLPFQSFKVDCTQAKAGKLINTCKR